MLPGRKDKPDIDPKEIYRYLGYGKSEPDEHVAARVEECAQKLRQISELRSHWMRFDLRICAAGEDAPNSPETVLIGDVEFASRDLGAALEGCVEVYVFGATIGIGVDRLIAKATVDDVLAAAIYQAAGAAYIESYCDLIQEDIRRIAAEEGRGIRTRFSPGYGDLDIGEQKKVFDLLQLTKHTGIGLTEGMLMTPSKSVTAIIGVTCEGADPKDGEIEKRGHNCSLCNMENCQYRKK